MMIKPFVIEMFATGNYNRAKTVIINLNVIILFGTSYGDTDEVLWKWIMAYMLGNNKRIIHCLYENDSVRPTHETNVIRGINYPQKKLVQRLGENNQQAVNDLYDKIYPIRNNYLLEFTFTSKYRDIARFNIIKKLIRKQ